MDAVWQALTSVNLAIVLLLLIAAGALVGALVPQAPPPAQNSPERFAIWLEVRRADFGIATDLLAATGAFNVFGSLWFQVLMFALTANLLVGTVTRAAHVWRVSRRIPPANMANSMFELAPLRAEVIVDEPFEAAAERIERLLGRRRYRWTSQRADGMVQLAGIKNRYEPIGTLVTHAGVIVVILGVVAGGRGFVDSQFVMPVGTARAVGHDTGLDVELISFDAEYYAGSQGVPKDYRSEIVLREQGDEVARGTVRVNEPLEARGLRIHQINYGPAVVMRVRDALGNVLFDGPVPLRGNIADRFAGTFSPTSSQLEVFVIGAPATFSNGLVSPDEIRVELFPVGGTELVGLQELRLGAPAVVNGLEFTYVQGSRFTGLSIVKAPTLPAVWLGAAMVVLGSIATLYFPRRRIWIRLTADDQSTTALLASPKERGLPYEREFSELVNEAGAVQKRNRAARGGRS